MIRLIVDGECFAVIRQTADNCRKYSDALRQCNSPHVQVVGTEHVDVVNMFNSGEGVPDVADNRVPDVDRYRVSQIGDGYRLEPHPTCRVEPEHNTFMDVLPGATEAGSYAGTVVVVLESPHADEYVNGDVNSRIAPAQGVTGCNMDRLLAHALCADAIVEAGLHVANNSRVVIANPVQFQTSLWCIHGGRLEFEGQNLNWRTLRDAVWKTLWMELNNDFAVRLKGYRPTLILNCCTAKLQPEVTRWLRRDYGSIIYCVTHPSTWQAPVVSSCG